MPTKAIFKNIRVSHKRIQLLANMVKGKNVNDALDILKFYPSPSAQHVYKAVKSAVSNAENNDMLNPNRLVISTIFANKGLTIKRFKPMARGRAGRVSKFSSHLTVIVDEEA
ncbi:MAG: 50S ribosomal protein L22 [SAR202 cluster bacterium]|nr:50S ribosomal protein L22 [SAR202 cluster bacterium]